MPLRWLVTGAGGMLGTDLCEELRARGESVFPFSRRDLDVSSDRDVGAAVERVAPDVIVNCAAYTKVDLAEVEEGLATAINGTGVELLARAANRAGSLLVQVSTDFVFDGAKRTPYEVDDPTAPLSAYGRSKLRGEVGAQLADRHLVVRASWLFGRHGPNFVEAIRRQIEKGTNPLRVVEDQHGRPTWTPHLANAIIRLATLAHSSASARGIAHYADEGACSWYDFARAIVETLGAPTAVLPVSTTEFPRPARRPAWSVLSTARYEQLTGVAPQQWRAGLRAYLS